SESTSAKFLSESFRIDLRIVSAARAPVPVGPKLRTANRVGGVWPLVSIDNKNRMAQIVRERMNRCRLNKLESTQRIFISSHGCRTFVRSTVIQPINFIFDLGGETDSVQFVSFSQSAHGLTDFADFANATM